MQETSRVHVWLLLGKAFHALAARASAGVALVTRSSAGSKCCSTRDRRVRLVELTAKGRDLITKTFREHAAAME